MRKRHDVDGAVGEQVAQVRDVVVICGGVEEVASRDVGESLAQGDEAVEAADGRRDDLEVARKLVELVGEELQREVVAAQRDHQPPVPASGATSMWTASAPALAR